LFNDNTNSFGNPIFIAKDLKFEEFILGGTFNQQGPTEPADLRGRCYVRNSVGTPATFTHVFRDFPQPLEGNSDRVPRLSNGHLISNLFWFTRHPTIRCWIVSDTASVVKKPTTKRKSSCFLLHETVHYFHLTVQCNLENVITKSQNLQYVSSYSMFLFCFIVTMFIFENVVN
jgi:hypothetical protein